MSTEDDLELLAQLRSNPRCKWFCEWLAPVAFFSRDKGVFKNKLLQLLRGKP